MHVVVSWEIAAGTRRAKVIERELKKQLGEFSWARPLNNLYVVRVSGEDDRNRILMRLENLSKAVPEQIKAVISPVMSSGYYVGHLPQDLWLRVNEIAEP